MRARKEPERGAKAEVAVHSIDLSWLDRGGAEYRGEGIADLGDLVAEKLLRAVRGIRVVGRVTYYGEEPAASWVDESLRERLLAEHGTADLRELVKTLERECWEERGGWEDCEDGAIAGAGFELGADAVLEVRGESETTVFYIEYVDEDAAKDSDPQPT